MHRLHAPGAAPEKFVIFMTKDGGLHVARGVTSGVSHAVKPTCRLAICCTTRRWRHNGQDIIFGTLHAPCSSRECAKSRSARLRSIFTPTIPFSRTHRQNGPPCRICGSLAELRRCASLSCASISPPRTHRVGLWERLHRRHQDYSWTCTTLRREVRRYDRLTVIYVNEPRDGESICLGINTNNDRSYLS